MRSPTTREPDPTTVFEEAVAATGLG